MRTCELLPTGEEILLNKDNLERITCCICYKDDGVTEKNRATVLTCKHNYNVHKKCLNTFYRTNPNRRRECPLCRRPVGSGRRLLRTELEHQLQDTSKTS